MLQRQVSRVCKGQGPRESPMVALVGGGPHCQLGRLRGPLSNPCGHRGLEARPRPDATCIAPAQTQMEGRVVDGHIERWADELELEHLLEGLPAGREGRSLLKNRRHSAHSRRREQIALACACKHTHTQHHAPIGLQQALLIDHRALSCNLDPLPK